MLHADRVNVRATPSSEGKVVDNLPMASAISVEELLEKSFKMGEVTARWVKISYQKDGKTKSGYIWSGLIALTSYQEADLTATFGYNTAAKNSSKEGQLRLSLKGKEIASVNFDSPINWISNSPELVPVGKKGFTGLQNIFTLNYSEDYCGGAAYAEYVFWTAENKLVHVHTTSEGADAPVFASETQTFPEDEGGKPNCLHIKRESGEMNEEGEEVINEREDFWLKWDGKQMRKTAKP